MEESYQFAPTLSNRIEHNANGEEPAGTNAVHLRNLSCILSGHFYKIIPDAGGFGSNHITALCMKCQPKQVPIKGCRNSTSNFISHLKRQHGEEAVEEYQRYKKEYGTPAKVKTHRNKPEQKLFPEDQKQLLNERIVKFVVDSLIPLKVVENRYFKEIVESANLGSVLSRRQLGRQISSLYNRHVENIKEKIKLAKYICTTADIWSSKRRSFFGVTAHWIEDDYMERQSAALACKRFKGTHSFDSISVVLSEAHAEYGITENKLVATVTNNVNNFVKSFEIFGVDKSIIIREHACNSYDDDALASDSDEEDISASEIRNADHCTSTLPYHISCSSHTLNLCASEDVKRLLSINLELAKTHSLVMGKCNALWRASQCPASAEIVKDFLGHTLSRPAETSWNSLLNALREIYTIRQDMDNLAKELNMKNFLQKHEFEYISEYVKCVQPVAKALDVLQDEENMYFGILLPCILSVKDKLEAVKEEPLVYCKQLAISLYNSIITRFYDLLNFTPNAETAVIAALSYPRFKNRWFTLVKEECHQRLLDLLKKEVAAEKASNATIIKSAKRESTDDFFAFSSTCSQEETCLVPTWDLEVLQYLSDEDRTLDCLKKYPTIKKIFLKTNTILPSSAPVERLFSFETMLDSARSRGISDDMFEKRVVLKSTLN